MTTRPVEAPFNGTIEEWLVEDGEEIHAGEELVIITIKNRSVTVLAEADGSVKKILHAEGETVLSGWKLAIIEEIDAALSSLEDAMTKDSQFLKDIKKVVEDVVKPRFDAIDARFDGVDAKLDALSGVNAKLDQLLAGQGGKSGSAPKPPKG